MATLNLPGGTRVWGTNVIVGETSDVNAGWIAWDFSGRVKPQIDVTRATGGNCVRVTGAVQGVYEGTITLPTYLAHWAEILKYCRLKGLYCYPTGGTVYARGAAVIGNTSTPGSIIHTITALATLCQSYTDVCIGIDLWNEPIGTFGAISGPTPSEAAAIHTAAAAVTTLPLAVSDYSTISQTNGFADGVTSTYSAYISAGCCDFLDFHIYADNGTVAGLDTIRAAFPTKDILIGEYGEPLINAANRTNRFTRAIQHGSRASWARGALVWAATDYDTNLSNMYGLVTRGSRVPYDSICKLVVTARPDAVAGPAPTPRFSDTFTGSAGVNIASRAPDTGTSWTAQSGAITLDGIGGATASAGNYYLPTPDADDIGFTCDVNFVIPSGGVNQASFNVYVGLGVWTLTDNNYQYLVRVMPNTFANSFTVQLAYRSNPGAFATIYTSSPIFIGYGTEYVLRTVVTTGTPNTFAFSYSTVSGAFAAIGSPTNTSTRPAARNLAFLLGDGNSGQLLGCPKFEIAGASAIPTTPAAAPIPDDSGGRVALVWPVALLTNFGGYRLYKDGILTYSGPLARYADAEVLPGKTHSYTYTIIDATGAESLPSPALVYGPITRIVTIG